MGKRYRINEKFFDEWSETMAYVLGYFFGDGCLYEQANGAKRVQFYGMSEDVGLLGKIAVLMECNSPVKLRSDCKVCYFELANRVIFDRLRVLGKNRVLKMPPVPDEFLKDFVRGFVDADGYVGAVKNSYGRKLKNGAVHWHEYRIFKVQFKNKSDGILRDIENRLRAIGYPSKKVYGRKGSGFSFEYAGSTAGRLAQWLYEGNAIALLRKESLQGGVIGSTQVSET